MLDWERRRKVLETLDDEDLCRYTFRCVQYANQQRKRLLIADFAHTVYMRTINLVSDSANGGMV